MEAPTEFQFNPLDPAFLADRWPSYRRLQDEAPLYELPFGSDPTYVVTRHAHVNAILRHPASLSHAPGADSPAWLGKGPAARMWRNQMVLMDPPDHTRLRRLVSHGLTPRHIAVLREHIERDVDRRLADLAQRDEIDAVTDFAEYVPASAICAILGIPESDWPDLVRDAVNFVLIFSPFPLDAAAAERCNTACGHYIDYFSAIIYEQRRHPREGIVGDLIRAEEQGDRLSVDELMATLHAFLNAGFETTMSTISNGIQALLHHRAQYDRLLSAQVPVTDAIEEVLRWEAPVHFAWRYASEDIDLGDDTLEAGSRALIGLAASGRDSRRFADADQFDIGRTDGGHLAFGGGRHFCIGAHLARMQLEIAFEKFAEHMPDADLVDQPAEREPNVIFPTLHSLPISVHGT